MLIQLKHVSTNLCCWVLGSPGFSLYPLFLAVNLCGKAEEMELKAQRFAWLMACKWNQKLALLTCLQQTGALRDL